jgi:hypothetical protein
LTTGILLLGLAFAWMVLAVLTFRPPDTPHLTRLFFFLLWLGTSFALGYFFLVKVFDFNPNPYRVEMARLLTDDKTIYLGDLVPGLYDLDYISRVDTDWEDEAIKQEWLAFYQYDVATSSQGSTKGPFGGAIYDYDDCRPPAILSYELVPVSYDYLGQDAVWQSVENIIPYADPVSAGQDRPELIMNGSTQGVVTDLNVFRKVGVALDCFQLQQWRVVHPGEAFPNPLRYENIGSFRGNYRIARDQATITVVDRSPFERSQIAIRRQYRPENGSYFRPGTQVLLDPVEYSLIFGPGQPDQVPQVYYPEKAVLAFYLNLTKDKAQLETAKGYLSTGAQQAYDIETDPFGLSTDPNSVARARDKLARVLVWEIRYQPDVAAEQLHQDRQVTVIVTGVDKDGNIDYAHPCQVTWQVVGRANPQALPYGCEWALDWYRSTCPAQ